MYADDSGTSSLNDQSPYYVISGIIIDETKIRDLKKRVHEYKLDNFKGEYIDAEIHVHDITGNSGDFVKISREDKTNLLNNLYSLIPTLPITTVSVVINKPLLKIRCPTWNVFTTAWIYLAERFDNFIKEAESCKEGMFRVDESTKEQESDVEFIVKDLQRNGSKYASMKYVTKDPIFLNSLSSEGIQVADAIAYCTYKKLRNNHHFIPHWERILPTFWTSKVLSYGGSGYKEFPLRVSE